MSNLNNLSVSTSKGHTDGERTGSDRLTTTTRLKDPFHDLRLVEVIFERGNINETLDRPWTSRITYRTKSCRK